MKVFTLLFTALELVSQLLIFSKLAVIVVLMMIFCGIYSAKPSTKLLAAFSVLIAITYVQLTPFLYWCRGTAYLSGRSAGFWERIDTVGAYWTTGMNEMRQQAEETGVQSAWTRLCTVQMQAFAVDAFDRGHPGDSLGLIPYTVVPRLLWPGKPIISIAGDYNILATGSEGNCTAPGVMGELYWNGGWTAVVLGSIYLGIALAVFSNVVVSPMEQRDFRVLPLVFFGLLMALRIEDFFVLQCVAPVPICAIYYLIINKVF